MEKYRIQRARTTLKKFFCCKVKPNLRTFTDDDVTNLVCKVCLDKFVSDPFHLLEETTESHCIVNKNAKIPHNCKICKIQLFELEKAENCPTCINITIVHPEIIKYEITEVHKLESIKRGYSNNL